MKLLPAMPQGGIDRYIGYYEPYATSHDALDRYTVVQRESATRRKRSSRRSRYRAQDSSPTSTRTPIHGPSDG